MCFFAPALLLLCHAINCATTKHLFITCICWLAINQKRASFMKARVAWQCCGKRHVWEASKSPSCPLKPNHASVHTSENWHSLHMPPMLHGLQSNLVIMYIISACRASRSAGTTSSVSDEPSWMSSWTFKSTSHKLYGIQLLQVDCWLHIQRKSVRMRLQYSTSV